MTLRPGVYLQNRYEILDLIGSGGMSEVYRAHCHKLNRDVAIKLLKKEFCSDEEFVRKFKYEAQAAAALNHPNIVNIYDVVDEEELHYIVMELVDGITLKEYILQKGKLGISEAVGIATQVARGIGAAHERRIIHRDVKPQNMILSRDGKVKVADFGIARAVSSQTVSSQAMGSVHYISPEQAKGEFTDERSDIYSLGVTLYEMLTGRLPFQGDTAVSVALSHIEETMTPPSVYNPDIPAGLEKIILKCCAKDPEARYQNVDALIADMKAVQERPDELPPGTASEAASDGSTRMLSKQEMAEIRSVAGRKSRKAEPAKQTSEEESEDAGLNRMLKTVGMILAVAVAVAALSMLAVFSGVFRKRAPQSSAAVAQETEEQGQESYMPYIIGLSQQEAEKKLAESGLLLTVTKREHSEQFAKDLVMEQKPEAGEKLQKNAKAEVTLSLGSAETELAELKLTELNESEAESALRDAGFEVQIVDEHSETVPEGKVIEYSPLRAKEGDVVTLKVSLGRELKDAVVPNLIGDREDQARQKLLKAGLQPGTVSLVHSTTVAEGIIISQGIDAGSIVLGESAVDYVVSSGPSDDDGSVPIYSVEPISGDSNSRYVASINNTYELSNLIGPGASSSSVTVMIRLRQEVGGQSVYQTLMEPRTVTADTIMPVRFKAIEGVYGVDTGYVEILQTDTGTVLQSYEVQFFKVQ